MRTLKDLKPGQWGVVNTITLEGALRRRLVDMGVTPGVEIMVRKVAPLGDPIQIHLRGYELSIRKQDAANISMESIVTQEKGKQYDHVCTCR